MNGDLWLDEAWVANSVLMPGWREMFFYPPWLQTTPPLYLTVTRLLVAALGEANWVFRAPSLLLGLASVGLAVHLGRRMFSPLGGWLAGALIALSGSAVMFSKEGKQYSGELFAAFMMMLLIVELPAWWLAAGAMLAAFGLAYSSAMFFPGVVIAYLLARRVTMSQLGVMCAALAVPMAGVYWFYLRPNQSDDLRLFWSSYFPQGDPLGYYFRITRAIFSTHHWEPLRSISLLRQLTLALVAAGFGRAIWRLWRERDGRVILTCLLPFGVAIVLNLLGLYPYGTERFSVYLESCVVLLLVGGLDWPLPRSVPVAVPVLLMAATVGAAFTGSWPRRVDVGLTEARQEMRRQGVSAGDLLFLAPFQVPGYALAQRRDPLPIETVEGRVSSPCCPRDGRWQPKNQEPDVAGEMDTVIARGTGRRIWMLHLRLMMLSAEGRMMPEVWQRDYLVKRGCREEFARQYRSTVLSSYRCPLL